MFVVAVLTVWGSLFSRGPDRRAASVGGGGPQGVSPADLRDPPGMHGMLLFGEGPFYLSHLPMYHRPHDYQAIFEVEMDAAATAAYLASARSAAAPVYHTIAPEIFVLPRLAAEGFPFRARVHRAHFERGGEVLIPEAVIRLRRVLVFEKLQAKVPRPEVSRYWAFGTGGKTYLAHRIGPRPDFDQIVEVATSRAFATPVTEVLLGGREDRPLKDGETVRGTLAGDGEPVSFTVRELYTETGDLDH